jgi:outer membrane receptor protein involved in Fe transport
MKKIPSYTPVAFAVAALLQAGVVQAQESLKLDEVVVTSSSTAKSKMRSSVSVTDIDQEAVKDFGARTESEVLLLIPGIRTEATAGPGGNANISVRGLPISSGGSKYVQIQEDGLPTVQFGDMMFSNNDYWTRFDNNVDSIQTLRGGSSSVYASHAPGAVINYMSKTGKEQGGSIGITKGLNFNETRVDGDVGGRISDDTYFHVGGYFRDGEGARQAAPGALHGYQVKANFTKEFNGTKGYVRLNLKALDETAPTTPQTFLTATSTNGSLSNFGNARGFNGLYDSQYSKFNSTFPAMDPVTGQISQSSLTNGITSKSKSVGFEFHNELNNGFTVDNKFRVSQNAGAFQTQFWDVKTLSSALGGLTGASYAKYLNGPKAGQVVTDANLASGLVSTGGAINVQTPDMGNFVNDFSVTKAFDLGDGKKLNAKAGLFYSRQNVVQKWSISTRVVEAAYNGAVIDVYNAQNAALTNQGLTGYNNSWGADSAKNINEQFTTTAPYLGLNLETGNWDLDAGIRNEHFRGYGYADVGQATGVAVNNISGANVYQATNRILADYTTSYNNYSAGANYRINKDQSVFGRYSLGHRAISDRLLTTSSNFNALGGLAAGAGDIAVAPVAQLEFGTKTRGNLGEGRYALSATYFHSTTKEFDYDPTRNVQRDGPYLRELGYKADGVEFESGFSIGNFALNANAVYSDESFTKNTASSTYIGKTPAGSTKWRYTLSPRYTMGDTVFGATARGVGKMYLNDANTSWVDGHYIINAFVNHNFGNGMIGSLNVNNLFNKLYPSSTAGLISGNVYGAGVETGRTISATVRYKF